MADGEQDSTDRRGRLAGRTRRTSIATRLSFAVLGVTIVALIVTAAIGLRTGEDLATSVGEDQFDGLRSNKSAEISRYIGRQQRNLATLAESPMVSDAIAAFTPAFEQLAALAPGRLDADQELLVTWYEEAFAPALSAVRGTEVSRETVPQTDAAVHLQATYLASSLTEAGDEQLIEDGGDGTRWTSTHDEFHPILRDMARSMGFSDLYLIEPENYTIVYSVQKNTDFATSLVLGPNSGTGLSAVVGRAGDNSEGDEPAVSDLGRYAPRLDDPTAFVSTAVRRDGEVIGIIAGQMTSDPIDEIMTGDGDWDAEGLGETGEALLIGSDATLRSESRPFLEDPEAYFTDTSEAGTLTAEEAAVVEATGTTVLVQEVDVEVVQRAETEGVVTDSGRSYLGHDSFVSFQPVGVADLDWVVLIEIDQAEFDEPLDDFRVQFLLSATVFVVALTFAAVIWANRMVLPVRVISDRLRLGPRQPVSITDELPRTSPTEFRDLAGSFDAMNDALAEREDAVQAAAAERRRLLGRLLPPAVARRVEAGDRKVVDQISRASLVVVIVEGLDAYARGDRALFESTSRLGDIVEVIDQLALQHGVERVKIIGDAYYGACGISRPYLDHVPRAVAFAVDVHDAIQETATEQGVELAVHAGIHTGPLYVGLTGSSRLAYDLWGKPVEEAHTLAASSEPGQILLSEAARDRLPDDVPVERGPHLSSWQLSGDGGRS